MKKSTHKLEICYDLAVEMIWGSHQLFVRRSAREQRRGSGEPARQPARVPPLADASPAPGTTKSTSSLGAEPRKPPARTLGWRNALEARSGPKAWTHRPPGGDAPAGLYTATHKMEHAFQGTMNLRHDSLICLAKCPCIIKAKQQQQTIATRYQDVWGPFAFLTFCVLLML